MLTVYVSYSKTVNNMGLAGDYKVRDDLGVVRSATFAFRLPPNIVQLTFGGFPLGRTPMSVFSYSYITNGLAADGDPIIVWPPLTPLPL